MDESEPAAPVAKPAVAKKAPVAEKKAAPVAEPVEAEETVAEEDGEVPACFGLQYGPRRPECAPCASKVPCRDKFLDM